MQRGRFDGGSLADIREMRKRGEDRTCEARLAAADPATADNRFWTRARWVEPEERQGLLATLSATLAAVRRRLTD